MLTGKYPGELFGDEPLSEIPTPHEIDASPAPPELAPPLHFGADEPVAEVSTDEDVTSPVLGHAEDTEPDFQPLGAPTGQPVHFDADPLSSTPDVAPRTARLVLSQASRRILVTLLILGVIGNVADTVLRNKLLNNQSALTRLATANNALNAQVLSLIHI